MLITVGYYVDLFKTAHSRHADSLGCSPTLFQYITLTVRLMRAARAPHQGAQDRRYIQCSNIAFDAASVFIVPVQAAAQLLPVGRWAKERLEGARSFDALPSSPASPSIRTSTSLSWSETMGKLGTANSSLTESCKVGPRDLRVALRHDVSNVSICLYPSGAA